MENYSKPPIRAQKTHDANERASRHLKRAFSGQFVADISADEIEHYLRRRLKNRVRVKTKGGIVEKGLLKPTTVHQELRVLRRMLSIAVKKRLLSANPCAGVEFFREGEGAVSATLHVVVEAVAHRSSCSGVAAEYHPDHHGNGTPGL